MENTGEVSGGGGVVQMEIYTLKRQGMEILENREEVVLVLSRTAEED